MRSPEPSSSTPDGALSCSTVERALPLLGSFLVAVEVGLLREEVAGRFGKDLVAVLLTVASLAALWTLSVVPLAVVGGRTSFRSTFFPWLTPSSLAGSRVAFRFNPAVLGGTTVCITAAAADFAPGLVDRLVGVGMRDGRRGTVVMLGWNGNRDGERERESKREANKVVNWGGKCKEGNGRKGVGMGERVYHHVNNKGVHSVILPILTCVSSSYCLSPVFWIKIDIHF